jgi:ribosomal protein S18 acetylase RimI-like enzyme
VSSSLRLRPATPHDAANLAILMDMASRGLVSWVWSTLAQRGQSPLELGRNRIRTHSDIPSHYANWTVAEVGPDIVGAFAGYMVPDPYAPGDVSELPDVYRPLLELEALAAGSWFLMALAVYPEFHRRGFGSALLAAAEQIASKRGASQMTLTVSTENDGACVLYMRHGFSAMARRQMVPYPGSGDNCEWMLLVKPCLSRL